MSGTFREWRHCPRCDADGTVTWRESDNPSFSCPVCFLEVFDSPWVGTIALIENADGHLLLMQRAIKPCRGMWDLPGGFLTKDESLDECVAREVEEETTLRMSNIAYVGNSPSVYGSHPALSVIFKGDVEGDPLLSDENLAFQWWSPEGEIPELAFPMSHTLWLCGRRKSFHKEHENAETNSGRPDRPHRPHRLDSL